MSDLFAFGIEHQLILRQASPRPNRRLLTDDGAAFIDFATTSYLGLEFDDRCISEFYRALRQHGSHVYCSPIYLRPPSQITLEAVLAESTGYAGAAIFSSVTLLHQGVLPLLAAQHAHVFLDEYAHRSIHDSLRVGTHRRPIRYRHCDLEHLKEMMACQEHHTTHGPLIITDGVFSMSGGIAPLRQLAEIVMANGGILYIDDSHGFGVWGDHGEGLATVSNSLACKTIYVGSLSKSMNCPIAFLAGNTAIVQDIRTRAAACLFSGNVSIPYMEMARVMLAISRSEEGKARRAALARNTSLLVRGLEAAGHAVLHHGRGIVAVRVQSSDRFRTLCLLLHNRKIAFNPVTYPAIPRREYRLRFCVSASHTKSDIKCAIEAISERAVV